MRTLIKDAVLITQNKKREIISPGFVVIDDDQIVKVGHGASPLTEEEKCSQVVDASSLVVLPGLVNAHVHLGESAYWGLFASRFGLEDYLKMTEAITQRTNLIEKERKTIADYSLLQLIKSGTSTIAGGRTAELAESWDIMNVSGYMIMDSFKLRRLSNDLEKKFLRECKKISQSELSRPALFLHSLNRVSPAILPTVKKILNKFPSLLLFIHIAETKLQEQEIKRSFGLSSAAVLKKNGLLNKQTVLIHGNWLSRGDLDLVKKNGASIIHCLSSNLKVADRHLDLRAVLRKKIPVCLATDGVVTSDTFSVLEEAQKCFKYYRRLGKFVSWQTLFDLVTIEAAKILGLDNLVGSLEVGKRADLVFVSRSGYVIKNPKKQLLGGNKVYGIMVAGQLKIWREKFLPGYEKLIASKFLRLQERIKKISYENHLG